MSIDRDLSRMVASIVSLEGSFERVGADIAERMQEHVARTSKAGQNAYGVPLQPRKDSGKPTMTKATRNIDTTAVGNRIYQVVKGVEARHHLGAAKGKVKRPTIFNRTDSLPSEVSNAIKSLLSKDLAKQVSDG